MPRAHLRLDTLEARLTPAIRLDIVALHEFGHALGLGHSSDSSSIMYAYYNPSYSLNNFANDSAAATFWNLFANIETSPWKDSLDATPGNGQVDITYSFMPNGAKMDKGTNNLFTTFDKIAPTATWQKVFTDQLNRWASVSNGHVAFVEHSDAGAAFNYVGAAQNDQSSGDIRIGAHRFDGTNKVLAHTYFPPPNGRTAAGDSHYDSAESWILSGGSGNIGGGGHGGGPGNLFAGELDGEKVALVFDPPQETVVAVVIPPANAPVRSNLTLVTTAEEAAFATRGKSEVLEVSKGIAPADELDPCSRMFDYDAIRPIEV